MTLVHRRSSLARFNPSSQPQMWDEDGAGRQMKESFITAEECCHVLIIFVDVT